jgi:hypothetical protein
MRPVQRDVIDKFAKERYQSIVQKAKKQAGPAIGTIEAARLLDRREFVYRGRAYSVAPVPWALALEMLDVREQFQTKGMSASDTAVLFERAAHLSKLACRPVGVLRRMFWRFLPNEFRLATPFQTGRHLGFFLTCLALDSLDDAGARPPARGTSSRTSRASSGVTRPGSARMASPSLGLTS